MSDPVWFVCSNCAQMNLGGPPHGHGPCLLKVKVDEAYIAMLDAQRMSHLRTGSSMSELTGMLGKLTGRDEDT